MYSPAIPLDITVRSIVAAIRQYRSKFMIYKVKRIRILGYLNHQGL